MTTMRARLDAIIVREVDGEAVQYHFFTTLRDQLELTKRYPKATDDPATAGMKLIYIAAQRCGIVPDSETFDEFIDNCLDLQIEDLPPLVKG